jgi:phage terminase small subunit
MDDKFETDTEQKAGFHLELSALQAKHRRFLIEYLVDLNGAQAAIRAGYGRKSARAIAHLILKRPEVVAAVREALQERARRTEATADRVVREYARIAFTDMRRFTEWGPTGVTLRPHTALSDDDAAAVAEVSRGGAANGARLKLHDKRAALDALARHLGMFGPPGRGKPPRQRDFDSRPARDARAMLRDRIEKIVKEREDLAAELRAQQAETGDGEPERKEEGGR